jgi:hypothetical protein
MHETDEIDQMLRSALSTYGDPGLESGIEGRVLARIAAEKAPVPRRRWLPWGIALPVAAALILLLVLSGSRPTHSPAGNAKVAYPPNQSVTSSARLEAGSTPGTTRTEHGITRRTVAGAGHHPAAATNAPLPKLDVFPSPQPLTPEEQALVAFAARAPEPVRQALIDAQKQADAPLNIAAIEIQPLDPPDQGGN